MQSQSGRTGLQQSTHLTEDTAASEGCFCENWADLTDRTGKSHLWKTKILWLKPLPSFSLLKHKRLQLIFDKNYFGGRYCILCQDRKTQTGCHVNLTPVLLLPLFHFPWTSEAFLQCKSFSSLSEKDPVYIWIFTTDADIRNGKICKIRANSSLPLKKHWPRKKAAGLSQGIGGRGASITQAKISTKDP